MRKYLPLSVAVLSTGCASFKPPDDWSQNDTARQVAYSVILAMDAASTARIHKHPELQEVSPLASSVLGPQPDPTETYVAAVLVGALNYWIARRMKPERRRIWQYTWTGINSVAVHTNCENDLC